MAESRFTLTIELGNDAMQTPADVGRALQTVALQIANDVWAYGADGRIRDANGNACGRWEVAEDATEVAELKAGA